jgi:ABC-type bacteriocin/lantibiotic exporter with double-glycine peptidase domain
LQFLDKHKISLLVSLIGFGALIEILAVGALGVVITGGEINSIKIPIQLSLNKILIGAAAIWILSGVMNAFVQFSIIKFSFSSGKLLAARLLAISIENGKDMANAKSVVDVVVNEVGRVIGGVFIPAFVLTQKIFVLLFTLAVVTFIFGITALWVIGILIVIYFIVILFVRKRTIANGKMISEFNNLRTDILLDIEEGRNLIKINQLEKYIINKFTYKTTKTFNAQIWNQTYAATPKYVLETAVVLSLILLYWLSSDDINLANKVLFIGAVAIKILPSLQGAFSALTLLNGHLNSWEFVVNYLRLDEKSDTRKIIVKSETDIVDLDLSNVSILRNNGLSVEASNIHLHVGKIIGIIGESGSGKSTFGYTVCGLESSAKIEINSVRDIFDLKNDEDFEPWMLRSLWGYVPQTPFLFDNNLMFNILHSDSISSELYRKTSELLDGFDLLKSLPPKSWSKLSVGRSGHTLSGGQTQRIVIASSVLKGRKFLFLDEVTSALDENTAQKILDIIKNLRDHCGILMVTHNYKQLAICDEVLEFKDGKILRRYSKSQILENWST